MLNKKKQGFMESVNVGMSVTYPIMYIGNGKYQLQCTNLIFQLTLINQLSYKCGENYKANYIA